MKIFKIIYYIVIGFIVAIALLMIISAFPIPGNYKIMVVQSGSMEPAIKIGSVLLVKPSSNYRIGDIITFGPFSKTQIPTTHRIHEIRVSGGTPIYITKGDANNAPDQRELTEKDILGKVLISIPCLGYAVDLVKKPIGFALIILIPASVIIFDEIKKIYGEIKKKKTIE